MRAAIFTGATMAVALGLALAGWRTTSRAFVDYRSENPPSVTPTPGPCTRTGLVAHWPLDAEEKGAFVDASGLGHTLAIDGSFAPFAAQRFGAIAHVDGPRGGAVAVALHHWLVGPNSACFASDSVSVAAWVYLEDAAHVPTIMAKSAWPTDGWWLLTTSVDPLGSDRRLQLGIGLGNGIAHIDADYTLPLREWHHVAFSIDNAAREVRFFIDGVPHGGVHRDVPHWLVNWSHPIVVGDYDGSGRWPWHGRLDDVRVWNRLVTNAEVADAFGAGAREGL
jgi:hypothetical protein